MPNELNELLKNYKECLEVIIENGPNHQESRICKHEANDLASLLIEELNESSTLDETTQDLVQRCIPASRAFSHHLLLQSLVEKAQLDSTTLIDNTALSKLADAQQRYENKACNHIELGGICFGISMMLRNAFFTRTGLDSFQKRLKTLVNDYYDYYKQGLFDQPDQIKSLEEYCDQRDNNIKRVPSQTEFVDLMIFFNQLRVYQRPDSYVKPDLYVSTDSIGKITQKNNPLDKTLQPTELGNDSIDNIAILLVKEPDEATFDELIAQAQHDRLSCVVSVDGATEQGASGHAIFIGYDNYNDPNQPWLLMDINRMPIKRGKTPDVVNELNQTLYNLQFQQSSCYWGIHIATQQSQQPHIGNLQDWVKTKNQSLFNELSPDQRMLLALSVCTQTTKLDDESSQKLIRSLDVDSVKACCTRFHGQQLNSDLMSMAMGGNNMPVPFIRELLQQLCFLAKQTDQKARVYLRLRDFTSLAYIDRSLLRQVYSQDLLPIAGRGTSNSKFIQYSIPQLLKETTRNPDYQFQALNNVQDLLFYYDITFSDQQEMELLKDADNLKIDESRISHSEFMDLLRNKIAQYDVYKQFTDNQANLQQLMQACPNCDPRSLVAIQHPLTGDSLLHVAAKKGDDEGVKTLLNKGADPTIKNADRKTPRDLGNDAIQAIFNQHMTIMTQYKTDVKPSQSLLFYSNPSQEADVKQLRSAADTLCHNR